MIHMTDESVSIHPFGLFNELENVVDLASLCQALNEFLKQPQQNNTLFITKNKEKNIIINSLRNKRQIFRKDHQYHVSPGFENITVKVVLSKRRQDIIAKQLRKEVLNNPLRNNFINCGSSYDPKIHEDYVYSDANWSPSDASL